MPWYTYAIGPIDFGWEHLETCEAIAKKIAASEIEHTFRGSKGIGATMSPELSKFLECWAAAQREAKTAGWEGDFRNPPAVFWIPADNDFEYGFVIKQDNGGGTFVMSPVELPHLKRLVL